MEHQLSFLSSSSTKKTKTISSSSSKKKESESVKLFIDGASRGNPGPSGAGVYVVHDKDSLYEGGFFLGKKTNNQAEYLALALGLSIIHSLIIKKEYSIHTVHVVSDSQLLIQQMKGIYKVKDEKLKQLKRLIDDQRIDFHCTFTHVLRENNTKADELANKGIDSKKPLPASFARLLKQYE